MHIWEYMELEVKGWPKNGEEMAVDLDGKATVGRKRLIFALNLLGGKGWEAYDSESNPSSGVSRIYLKRRKN